MILHVAGDVRHYIAQWSGGVTKTIWSFTHITIFLAFWETFRYVMMENQCFVKFSARFFAIDWPRKAKLCLKFGFFWKNIRKTPSEDGNLSVHI